MQAPRKFNAAAKHWRLFFSLLVCLFTARSVQAALIVDVSGPVTTGGEVFSGNQATAVSFTLTQPFINVKVSAGTVAAPMVVVGGVGTLVITRSIGPGSTVGDIVATKVLTSSSTLFIDGLSLAPGTYYFLIALDSGSVGWPGSFSATVTTDPAAAHSFDFFASATGVNALTANYVATNGIGALLYNVNGDAAPLMLTCPSSTGQEGVPYSGSLMATGAVPPYTFSIFSGTLPPPLMLNASKGAITGTPTGAGTFMFTGKVTDSSLGTALTATVNCNIVISPSGTGCPAAKGFWHDPSLHGWPDKGVTVGGVIYEGVPLRGMFIASKHYTQKQLLSLMQPAKARGNGFVKAGSQLIAAVLNVAAGAQHSSSVDSAIKAVNDLLIVDGRMVGTAYGVGFNINPPPANNNALIADEPPLDNYNGAVGLGCIKASGLTLGSQPQPVGSDERDE
jgi:hypothetical protein